MRPVFYERKLRPYNKFNGRFLWRLLLLVLAVVVGNAIWKFGEKQVARYQSVKQTAAAEALLAKGEKTEATLRLRAALGHDARNIQANRLTARLMDEQGDPRAVEYYRFVVLDDGVLPGELADINFSDGSASDFFGGGGDVVLSGDRFHGTGDGLEIAPHATEGDAEALARAGVKYGNLRVAREMAITVGQKWNRPEFPFLINAAIYERNGDALAAEEEFRSAVAQRETPETLNALADFLLARKDNISARTAEAATVLARVAAVDQGEQGRKALRKILTLDLADPDRVPGLIEKYRALATGDQEALLFADDTELKFFPGNKARVVEGVATRSARLPVAARVAAGRWLLTRNEPARTAGLLPLKDAISDAAAFEVAVEALFALKQWNAAETALRSPANPLPPHQTGALLAAAASMQGKPDAAEQWDEVLQKYSGNPELVIHILEKAAANGQWEIVYGKLPSVLGDPAWSLKAYRKLLATARAQGDSEALLKIQSLAMGSRILAGDPEVRDSIAFDRLMAGMEVSGDELADRVSAFPENPSIRTTRALGLMLGGSKVRALYEIEESAGGVDPAKLAPPARAVFAAVLAANGRNSEAEKIADTIPEESLMPGEAEFLRKHLDAAAGAD